MTKMLPVKDHKIEKEMKVGELVKQMHEAGGFSSKKLAVGVDILSDMMKNSKLNFLSFPACIISTGTRGIIRDMVKKKMFQCLITTCGTLDHDIARSFENYFHGDFMMDDAELRKKGVSRLGNVLLPDKSYGIIIEKKMQEWLPEIFAEKIVKNPISKSQSDSQYTDFSHNRNSKPANAGSYCKKELSTYELCWEIGKRLGKDSILYWAWKNKIPVIIPGITDGAVGYQLWSYSQDHKIAINVLKDEQLLSDMTWGAKKNSKFSQCENSHYKSGALILGGGISKHHVLWWNQFRGGLDYAVYVSTASEYDGSLSGARPREAISWGKLNAKAKYVHIEGDVTVVLPLMYGALVDNINS